MNAATEPLYSVPWKGIIGTDWKMILSSIETNSVIKETMNSIRPLFNPMKEDYIII